MVKKSMIYFDCSATSLQKPHSVIDSVVDAISKAGNPARGVNAASLYASRLVFNTRRTVAEFFNVPSVERVVFTSSATESLNIAIKCLIPPSTNVITTTLEHNSVLRPLYDIEREQENTISFLECDQDGDIDFAELDKLYTKNTSAVVITHSSNVFGRILDLNRVGEWCKARKIILIVDASQTAGIIPIDFNAMNATALCCSAHKSLYGIQGIGILCLSDEAKLLRTWKSGGTGIQTFSKEQPRDFPTVLEAGTLNIPGIASIKAGIDFINNEGQRAIYKKEMTLLALFYNELEKIKNIVFYNKDVSLEKVPIASFNIKNIDSGKIGDILDQKYSIVVRSGFHCAPLIHKSLNTEAQGIVRFSFSHFNTEDEVRVATCAIKEIARES